MYTLERHEAGHCRSVFPVETLSDNELLHAFQYYTRMYRVIFRKTDSGEATVRRNVLT